MIPRYTKHEDIGTFKISWRIGEFYKQLKDEFVSVLFKYREADNYLKERVILGKIYFCERYFLEGDIEFTSMLVSNFILVYLFLGNYYVSIGFKFSGQIY